VSVHGRPPRAAVGRVHLSAVSNATRGPGGGDNELPLQVHTLLEPGITQPPPPNVPNVRLCRWERRPCASCRDPQQVLLVRAHRTAGWLAGRERTFGRLPKPRECRSTPSNRPSDAQTCENGGTLVRARGHTASSNSPCRRAVCHSALSALALWFGNTAQQSALGVGGNPGPTSRCGGAVERAADARVSACMYDGNARATEPFTHGGAPTARIDPRMGDRLTAQMGGG
jgi:hypothetical protein